MKKRLIKTGLELFLAGCLAFSTAGYSARGQEEKPASSESSTTLKDDGLYQEVFKGTIKEPEKLTKNPEKTIINFISLYPEERTEQLKGTNLLEKIMNGFEKEVRDDPLYIARRDMWNSPPIDHESYYEVPYAAQLGKSVWDVFREDYGWAQAIDKSMREVQKAATVEMKVKEKTRIRIKPLVEDVNGRDFLKLRADLLGADFKKIDYINLEAGINEATINIGKYTQRFGDKSEAYIAIEKHWDSQELRIILYLEVPNLSFWKEKATAKDLNSGLLINTGGADEKSNQ